MYDGYQSQALSTRLGIPMLYGVDAVHGHGGVKGATIFPHNIGLGCTRSPRAGRGGRRASPRARSRAPASTGPSRPASRCRATSAGAAPTRASARSPELAASLGAAAVRGFQSRRPTAPAILRLRQALPGRRRHAGRQGPGRRAHLRGGAAPHPPARLRRRRSRPASATVMVSYSSWNGQPMHGNQHLITDVLKGELGFAGFVVTDWAGDRPMAPGDYSQDIEIAINAGIDMVMVPNRVPRLHHAAQGAGRRRARPAGAHRRRRPPHPEAEGALRAVGAAVHRPRADRRRSARRRTARSRATPSARAWCVLKNDGGTLPLRKDGARPRLRLPRRRHGRAVRRLVGRLARPARRHHARHHHPPGASTEVGRRGAHRLLEGRAPAPRAPTSSWSVVGEDPYAEGSGDRAELELGHRTTWR